MDSYEQVLSVYNSTETSGEKKKQQKKKSISLKATKAE